MKRVHSREFKLQVIDFAKNNDNSAASRKFDVDRSTVRTWIKTETQILNSLCPLAPPFDPKIGPSVEDEAYCYILGLYLGDGYICEFPRTKRLRIFQYSDHERIISKCEQNLRVIFPNNSVKSHKNPNEKCTITSVYNSHLNLYFPQHGIGEKHKRKISLVDWQESYIKRNPEAFISGLLDSDGSRYFIRGKKLAYQFTQVSEDIKEIFKWSCSLIGINVNTRPGKIQTHIYRKKYTDILETFYHAKD